MSSALSLLAIENDAAHERVQSLRRQLEEQSAELARADERQRCLVAARSSHLLAHLRQHGEAEAQRHALDVTRKGITAAWGRIAEAQARNREIVLATARHRAIDAQKERQITEHARAAAEVEARAVCASKVLQEECEELAARLREEDDTRARQAQQERARLLEQKAAAEAAEAAEAAAAEAAAEAAAAEAAAEEAAAEAAYAAECKRIERAVERGVLNTLTYMGPADAGTIERTLGNYLDEPLPHTVFARERDAAKVGPALERLKAQWAVYEIAPGFYQCL